MTEDEWLQATDPQPMLDFLQKEGKLSQRKLRLFGCACVRRVWHLLNDQKTRKAVEAAEKYADGLVDETVLKAAWAAAVSASGGPDQWDARSAARAGAWAASENPDWSFANAANAEAGDPRGSPDWDQKRKSALSDQVGLLRHIVGNPFRRYPAPDRWPSPIVQLADALYNGQACAFALHDALEEAGHPELAAHFRDEKDHPKGCWVLDLILGKE